MVLSCTDKKVPQRSSRPVLRSHLEFAPRSQSFAFVTLSQYAQSVRYPNYTSFHSYANSLINCNCFATGGQTR